MDKGTQEKIAERFEFWPDYAVLCKGCKSIHYFSQIRVDDISFPDGDFSRISVYCAKDNASYYYKPEELMPYRVKGDLSNAKTGFHWDGEIVCKECKRVHRFMEYGDIPSRAYVFKFPHGDFSTVMIPCAEDDNKVHEYAIREILLPAQSGSVQVSELEKRILRLEQIVGIDKRNEDKSLQQRLTETEKMVTGIAEKLTSTKEKAPPKGQLA